MISNRTWQVIEMRINIAIAGVITLITLLIIGIHLSTGNEEFSRYNPGWNGTSGFFSLLEPHHSMDILRLSDLDGRGNATLLIIAPSAPYPVLDLGGIRKFVESGNTLFIADESGVSNSILQGIGSSITIQPGVLGSIDRAYNDPYVIVTIPDSDHPLVRNLTSLVLNHGSALTGGQPLIQSGMMSWIDSNKDRRVSEDESFGRRVVMARESIGAGEVIVLSDSGIFINSMLDIGDLWGNREFISRLVSYRPTLCVDQMISMTMVPAGPGSLVYLLRNTHDLKLLFVMIILLIIGFLVSPGRFLDKTVMMGDMTDVADQISPDAAPSMKIAGKEKPTSVNLPKADDQSE